VQFASSNADEQNTTLSLCLECIPSHVGCNKDDYLRSDSVIRDRRRLICSRFGKSFPVRRSSGYRMRKRNLVSAASEANDVARLSIFRLLSLMRALCLSDRIHDSCSNGNLMRNSRNGLTFDLLMPPSIGLTRESDFVVCSFHLRLVSRLQLIT
jgi:hypothetical protein